MCGIAGFFSAAPLYPEDDATLSRMLDTIYHRGPDGEGAHIDHARGVAMGHTRLSIIDLNTGEQPILSKDDRLALTVNGEFYDFKKYRSHAMAEGDRFRCKSDSEIALSLYRKYGLSFVDHLRGEFAFALYDKEQDQMIFVRDRFGIRPLFFHNNGEMLVYGSEVKSVIAHPKVPKRLCRKAALHQLMQTIKPGTSAFEGVVALEPGHMMVVKRRNGKLETNVRKYWDLDFPEVDQRDALLTEEDHIERIREKLIESIVFRLEADVPVGCYLSGGIDSCCILGLASGAMQSPVKAFTISFDDDKYDEAHIAKEMSDSMGADQEQINLKAADLYGENYIRTVWHAERTFYNTLGVAKYLMSKRVRECGYKTVVTGEGADELFGGYPAFKRDMFLYGLETEDPKERERLQGLLDESNKLFKGAILAENRLRHPAFEELCGFTPSWIQPWMATLELARPLLSDDSLEEIGDYDPIEQIASKIDAKMLLNRHPLDKAQYTWSKCQLEGQILNWGGDRVDMANSMESRPAFLDHHLAEAAIQVPPNLRIKGNVEKWVLREAVKGVLPEVLYKREKFAFMAPPAHTSPDKLAKVNELIERFLNPDSVREAGILSPERTETFLKHYREDKDPISLTRKDTLLNHLICLQIMHDKFIETEAAYGKPN
ncbi:asparagine synthase (glutamine-hydrolyzing) [Pelagicoccus sp. SDUM812003]|uniref:asparagine synthase (glutamine-hydrolyzing) n=1 Tax=Pelagicoccus sp. SDUM812003 TaxID=3041267 RepID=UPI0028109BA7|nr:asparagine synthase (glutamine-hydrolyzing) [Pelagicoccus sp. SDUM812003]MDQ8202900.1 asparagine synthase (glutamine-hydrolyzing) [Pelagicoccus sp. SDUM812003]